MYAVTSNQYELDVLCKSVVTLPNYFQCAFWEKGGFPPLLGNQVSLTVFIDEVKIE